MDSSKRKRARKLNVCCRPSDDRKEGIIMTEKFCTKCGKKFTAIGRQVICPDCKAAAEEETKRAAVLRAKRASWSGESVPVRISGRASTLIREYGKANNLPFAAALDDLLKSSDCFKGMQMAWEDITPYKSHRRDKSTATSTTETAHDTASKPQDAPQEVKQAAKTTSKTSTAKKAVKTAAGKAGKKA